MTQAQVCLRRGREGPVRGGNPWIFSQALEQVEASSVAPGALVEVRDCERKLIGYGHYNPNTTIAVRMLSWGGELAVADLLAHRIRRALELRQRLVLPDSDCYRLVNGDGDGLSGLVVDRYGDVLVVQILSAGMDRWRAQIVTELQTLIQPRTIFERSQGAVRREEGLNDTVGLLAGDPRGEVIVTENGIKLTVDVVHGQKSGSFLDQRDNRARFAALARGARVLDAYCYGGGFTLAALKGGARRSVAVDTSAKALGWARRNLELNGYEAASADFVNQDAFRYLAETSERFELIALDPPPLARSRKDAARAEHLYIELNALAIRALAPGGYLMSFSCSTHFRGEDFMRAMRIAHGRAGRRMRLLERLGAAPDHPVLLGHVEGEYLTGVLLQELN